MNKEEQEFEDWLATRPKEIQKLAREFPPNEDYVISDDAPYALSRPGTKVHIHSYSENGEIAVLVMAKDKLPEAIVHEKAMCKKYGRTRKETRQIVKKNCRVFIDPKFLVKIGR